MDLRAETVKSLILSLAVKNSFTIIFDLQKLKYAGFPKNTCHHNQKNQP